MCNYNTKWVREKNTEEIIFEEIMAEISKISNRYQIPVQEAQRTQSKINIKHIDTRYIDTQEAYPI